MNLLVSEAYPTDQREERSGMAGPIEHKNYFLDGVQYLDAIELDASIPSLFEFEEAVA